MNSFSLSSDYHATACFVFLRFSNFFGCHYICRLLWLLTWSRLCNLRWHRLNCNELRLNCNVCWLRLDCNICLLRLYCIHRRWLYCIGRRRLHCIGMRLLYCIVRWILRWILSRGLHHWLLDWLLFLTWLFARFFFFPPFSPFPPFPPFRSVFISSTSSMSLFWLIIFLRLFFLLRFIILLRLFFLLRLLILLRFKFLWVEHSPEVFKIKFVRTVSLDKPYFILTRTSS